MLVGGHHVAGTVDGNKRKAVLVVSHLRREATRRSRKLTPCKKKKKKKSRGESTGWAPRGWSREQ